MKKLLSMILVACMLMSVLCISASAEEATELTAEQKSELMLRKADADGNGSYSIDDARLLLKAAAGTTADADAYDVNSDGVTTVEDAIAVLKEVMGVEPLLSDDEAVALFNAKVNAVKEEMPGFEKVVTSTCKSMKMTQTMTCTNPIYAALLKNMECDNLEYKDYVDKMVGMTGTEDESAQALLESAKTYRDPKVSDPYVAAKGNYRRHLNYFPREGYQVASAITPSDISSISYNMVDGNIVFVLKLKPASYKGSAYPSDVGTMPYGKVFDILDFTEDGSTLNSVSFSNGQVDIKFNAETGDMVSADYFYNYYTDISSPPQTSTSDGVSVTLYLTRKTTASISESVVF